MRSLARLATGGIAALGLLATGFAPAVVPIGTTEGVTELASVAQPPDGTGDADTTTSEAVPSAAAETQTSWSWHAPVDADGPGAFRATVDFGEENRCNIALTGVGDFHNGPALRLSIGTDFWAYYYVYQNAQVHVTALGVDTRDVDFQGGVGLFWDDTRPIAGVVDLTILVEDMSDHGVVDQPDDPEYAAEFDISCAAPLDVVELSGSREVVSFSGWSLAGTGAHAGGGLVPGVIVNVEDTMDASFTAEAVEVDIRDPATTLDVRSWTLATPKRTFEESTGDLHVEDGPGAYHFSLTGVADKPGSLTGWMVGYNPVDELDDIFR